MKLRNSLSAIIFFLSLFAPIAAFALDPDKDWGRTDIKDGEDVTVTLTADIGICDAIWIKKGGSLTIYSNGHTISARNYNAQISLTNYNTAPISFVVEGTLKIYGTADNPAIITGANSMVEYGYTEAMYGTRPSWKNVDGNYNYKAEDYGDFSAGDIYPSNVIDVESGGTLELEYVKFQHLRGIYTDKDGTQRHAYSTVIDIGDNKMSKREDYPDVSVTLKNVKIDNCMAPNGWGVIGICGSTQGKVDLIDCEISNCRTYGYGGVIAGNGGRSTVHYPPTLGPLPKVVVTLTNCELRNCVSTGWGGSILWACQPVNGTKLVLEGCHFHHNYARCLGGAVSNESETVINNCKIENNYVGYGGGGVATFPFTLSGSGSGEANGLTLGSGNIIRNNQTLNNTNISKDGYFSAFGNEYPSGGGGIWILMNKSGWTCTSSIGSGNTITCNTSVAAGGGVMLYKSAGGTTSLTCAADITNNTAVSGGGIALGTSVSSDLPTMTINGGKISDNTASTNGGGIYMPGGTFTMTAGEISSNKTVSGNGGGVYMPEGTFTMEAGSVFKNYAKGNGGGFSISNGTITITGSSTEIYENNCSGYGAGLYVNGTGASTSFEGGVIRNNGATECKAGGGICVEGSMTLTTSASVEENNALNGGGICVIGGGTVIYKEGLIRNNTANTTETYGTGYQQGVTAIKGFGGGVFVADSGSKLQFEMSSTTPLGVYGNTATNGGDDIFSNGYGTVTIPKVAGMKLQDFNVPVSSNALFWAEDYATNDPNYGVGTKVNTSWVSSTNPGNERYRDALKNVHEPYRLSFVESENTKTLTCYTSLALGYNVLFGTIVKEGLKPGESALFDVLRSDGTHYCTVVLTGKEGTTSVSRRIALTPGDWKVRETNWSWAYNLDSSTDREQTVTIADGNPNKFTFKNNPNAAAAPHAEDIKVNEIK
ncbi:MAG: SpaA isopeptide-forming pilin-related protein [Muribaculaceae bacterium]